MTQKHIDLLNAAVVGNIQPEFVELVDKILHEFYSVLVGEKIDNITIIDKQIAIDTMDGDDGPKYHYSIGYNIFEAENPVKGARIAYLMKQHEETLDHIKHYESELENLPKKIAWKKTTLERLKERIIEATLED